MTAACVVGVDVGSTYVKAVLVEVTGAEVATARRPTPWRGIAEGRTEMDAGELLDTVAEVLAELAGQHRSIAGIGVSGMAESGVLLDAGDRVRGPVVAWFDPRGAEELADVPADLAEEFAGRTGLPLTPLATFAKLWHRHRTEGLELSGLQWLNMPELVAWWLTGVRLAETSLAGRTGLVDQDTGQAWPRAVEVLGGGPALLPPIRPAGSVWGVAGAVAPSGMAGAVVTVAGHDHLVSSVSCGVLDLSTLYDSMGTAEALVRVLDGVLDRDARGRLAAHGINVVRHMLPGRGVMLAGTKTGLLMRRALQLVGVQDASGRAALDEEVMALPDRTDTGLSVDGATMGDGVLTIRADADGLSPALLFDAALRHGSDVLVEVLAHMDAENPPATCSVLAGGWARMRSVRRSRARILPSVRFSDRDEDTAFGAALVAAFASDPATDDLASFLSSRLLAPDGDDRPPTSAPGPSAAPDLTPQGSSFL